MLTAICAAESAPFLACCFINSGGCMKIKSVVAAVALAAASVSGFAANYSAAFNTEGFASILANYAKLTGTSFNDTWTLSGVTAGTYAIDGSISGSGLSFNSVVMDGTPWTLVSNGTKTNFAELVSFTGSAPVTLSISGTKSGTAPSFYSGGISVTAVPEPETYAMLLAGLGVMGAIARRRKQAA
jgi:hypothetical protein